MIYQLDVKHKRRSQGSEKQVGPLVTLSEVFRYIIFAYIPQSPNADFVLVCSEFESFEIVIYKYLMQVKEGYPDLASFVFGFLPSSGDTTARQHHLDKREKRMTFCSFFRIS